MTHATLPLLALPSIDALADAFGAAVCLSTTGEAIGVTRKRKVDGTLAATRLGSTATERWANERFRQTMLIVREFRMEWPNMTLLTSDDVESIRWLVDCALYTATRSGHVGDIYDMSPTVWAIWLVQNQHVLKMGGWKVESVEAQQRVSFENLYFWLKSQYERGEKHILYDHVTKKLLKRYKLPFKNMRVPPAPNNIFKYVKGARRLSAWIAECQATMDDADRPERTGLPEGIIMQQPPELVAGPPGAAATASRRQAMWDRARAKARSWQRRPLRTAQEDSDDAELTRGIVEAVADESSHAQGGGSTESDEELERELEEALRDGERGGPSAEAD
jgi:hypothetical protein